MAILSRIRNTQSDDTAEALTSELVSARQTYEARRENVLTRVSERRAAVKATIDDLVREDAALAGVENEAARS